MTDSVERPAAQLGLLDLSVDLSVPEVYSGSDFTVYLHIKNPFAIPVWVRSVELSLPTQLRWRSAEDTRSRGRDRHAEEQRARLLAERTGRLAAVEEELAGAAASSGRAEALRAERDALREEIDGLKYATMNASFHVDNGSVVNLYDPRTRNLTVRLNDGSVANLYGVGADEPERVPLKGSLPPSSALEPGCTDVWTIRLGTSRNPLFLPAKYHLQLTVVYGQEPPRKDETPTGAVTRRLYSNTTSVSVQVKAALWKVMLGGVAGGATGSVARSLQDAGNLGDLVRGSNLSPALGALVLAVILSGAAIVFSARKSEAQSFVTVEDFWGGLLVGFLTGYSGTAAFGGVGPGSG